MQAVTDLGEQITKDGGGGADPGIDSPLSVAVYVDPVESAKAAGLRYGSVNK